MLSKVKDIEGLEEVSIWPLGIGWWLIISLILMIVSFFITRYVRQILYKKTWRYKVEKRLEKLAEVLNNNNAKRVIGELNELIKRIAIKEYGRVEVAKLNGKDWLKWLSQHDPKGFNWQKRGIILVTYPYMPADSIKESKNDILLLIKTSKGWL